MLFVSFLKWWYGPGWQWRASTIRLRIESIIDYFSIDLLAKTLFSPFRQISAGKVDGPLGVKFRAFADRVISRIIGAIIRLTLLVVGSASIILYALLGGIVLILWAVIPFVPIAGIVLATMGIAV